MDVDAFVNTGSFSRLSWSQFSVSQQRRLLGPFIALHSIMRLGIVDVDDKTHFVDVRLVGNV